MNALLLITIFTLNSIFVDADKPSIILINGVAHLVILDDNGQIKETLQAVPYYFDSDLSHEEIVAGLVDQMSKDTRIAFTQNATRIPKSEIDILENAEFIRFIPGKALLDRIAVDRIRKIAKDYVDGGIEKLILDIAFKDDAVSTLLADNRLDSVKDLLVAFGVEERAIEAKKNIRNDLVNNPFVRVSYKKDLR
jgi:hypothetical protein